MAILVLFSLALFFETHLADPAPSFSFTDFKNESGFGADIDLLGDAKVANGGSVVQITRPASSSAGRVMFKKPIKLVDGKDLSKRKVSFSTYFSFSLSPESGDGLAFSLVPTGFPMNTFDGSGFGLSPGFRDSKFKIFVVEYDTLKDALPSDLNGNHVAIDLGNGLKTLKLWNTTALNMTLNSGERFHTWIDYEAGSDQVDVRLSKSADKKPDPDFSYYPIDLSEMWKEGDVFVGLSSSNRKTSQTCSLFSWSFDLRVVPHWLHSQPFLPGAASENANPGKRSTCFLRFLAALIFGTGCGALIAFFVLFAWTVFGSRGRPVVPEEFAVSAKEFEYKKIKVIVDKEAVKDVSTKAGN